MRVQCSGTGAINTSSRKIPFAARASQSPAGRTISCLSLCFSAKTNARPRSLYKSAARPCDQGRAVLKHSSQRSPLCTSPCIGTPHASQTSPVINAVSRQHGPQRPSSLATRIRHERHSGGKTACTRVCKIGPSAIRRDICKTLCSSLIATR